MSGEAPKTRRRQEIGEEEFDDFEADSGLNIDGKEFGRRVLPALESKFLGWFVTAFGMTYIDPVNPGGEPTNLTAVKHVKYIHQQEQRILCHPRTPIQNLAAITLDVGPMRDIADLVRL